MCLRACVHSAARALPLEVVPANPHDMAPPQISLQLIRALVPLAEMFNYVSTLRSMSKGRAQYTMQVGDAGRACFFLGGGGVGCVGRAPLWGFARSEGSLNHPLAACRRMQWQSMPITTNTTNTSLLLSCTAA